jgi:hypothetical protein
MAHSRPPTEKEKQQDIKPPTPTESHGGNNAPDAPNPARARETARNATGRAHVDELRATKAEATGEFG